MKAAKPPALALWLLKHAVNEEALAGDLLEQFAHGRTGAWFWRQILASIPWRRHLFNLAFSIVFAWFWNGLAWSDSRALVSRPVDLAIVAALLLCASYLPGRLSRVKRVGLSLLMVLAFVLLYRYAYGLADRYFWCASSLICSLLFFHPHPHLRTRTPAITYRELLWGDEEKERSRLIMQLEQTRAEETNPQLRDAYTRSIAVLKDKSTN